MTTSQHLLALHDTAADVNASWLANHRSGTRRVGPPMHIAVAYARYSSDKQTETSVERQYELCADHAARSGLTLGKLYADRAQSGTTTVGRDELEAMLESARRGEFGVLIVENVDRLARDLSILSAVFKELKSLSIEIHQPGRGRLGLPDIAFHGFMGEESRRLFLERVQYGRIQIARRGLIPGKASYGYRAVSDQPGRRKVYEAEARVVREIFQMRAEGLTARKIAISLNGRPDADREWTVTKVRGMLVNPVYAGFYVYNRTMVITECGVRKVVSRPQSEWVVAPVEHLRIVDRQTWEAVQAMGPRKLPEDEKPAAVRPYLLSGKVRCPGCGGRMTVVGWQDQRRFDCARKLNGRKCDDVKTIKLDELEGFVIGLVAERVLAPDCTEAYVAAYNETRAGSLRDHDVRRAALERRIADLNDDLESTFDEVRMEGFRAKFLADKRRSLNERIEAAEYDLAVLPPRPRPIGIDQGRMTLLRDAVAGLLARVPFRPENEADYRLAAAFGELIDRIVVRRVAYGKFEAEVHLTVTPLMQGGDREVPSPERDLCLRVSYQRKPMRSAAEKWAVALPAHLAEGRHVLRDDEWEAIAHLLPDAFFCSQRVRRIQGDARTFVEAHLFVLMHDVSWDWLPAQFGSRNLVHLAATKMVGYGVWREVATVLTGLDAERYPAELADATWKKCKPSGPILRLVAERRAAEASARSLATTH